MIYAKDQKCIKCKKQAEVFWPMMDPDIQEYPYCRPCVDQAKMHLLIEICKEKDLGVHPKKMPFVNKPKGVDNLKKKC